jgi:L-aminopeptidase/D-esterase-like protein
MTRPRARDLGLPFPGTPGPWNAITDVPGVQVGFCTLTDPARRMRTGVTAILPRPTAPLPEPVRAGQFTLNGNGEMTGTHWLRDSGQFIGPICLTNTHAVGAVHHGVTRWMLRRHADWAQANHVWLMPVVAETYDGVLNDITALHVTPDHAEAALEAATSGPVAEGASGGGNGMIAYDFKAGTGTASRRVGHGGHDYMLGALVQANHGRRAWLQVLGVPVGRLMPGGFLPREQGSVIVILATDAPLSPLSLDHLARRAALGIGRGGTPGGQSSGDLFLAFSTAPASRAAGPGLVLREEIDPETVDSFYLAAVEAVEEAVINAIVAGEDTPAVKPEGLTVPGIDLTALAALFRRSE